MGLQKDWNKQAGKEMWKTGRGDAEIAKAMGVSQATISYFRRKHWEPERDAVSVAEVADFGDSDADTINDVDVPVFEGKAADEVPAPSEIKMDVPVCEPDINEEVEQQVSADVSPTKEGPGIARTEDVRAGHHQLIHALEEATGNMTGMDAVMTAQIISVLWGWTDKRDLLEAKACLDYLLRRHNHG